MAKCSRCNKGFNVDDARDYFNRETIMNYDKIRPCFCADCAIEAIENEEEDVYFEECPRCGKQFDYAVESAKFEEYANGGGDSLSGCWISYGPVCADCAIDIIEEINNMYS